MTEELRGPTEEEAATIPRQKDPRSPWKLEPQRAGPARAGATREAQMLPEIPPEVEREGEKSPGCSLPLTLHVMPVLPVGRTQPEGIDRALGQAAHRKQPASPTLGRARER